MTGKRLVDCVLSECIEAFVRMLCKKEGWIFIPTHFREWNAENLSGRN